MPPPDAAAPPDLPRPPAHPRRLVYLGTPAMAVAPLLALHAAGHDIALVVTGADKRRGRRAEPTPTPVKIAARGLGLPVAHDLADLDDVEADLGVVVAYGRILRRPLLDRLPLINLHFSLLPRWRGAAPVERAILAGDERTGVCVMAVEEGLDTGGVYASRAITVRRDSTAAELGATLTDLGAELLVQALADGLGEPAPQVGEPTYADKIRPDDLELRWDRPADELHRVVRVGGAWSSFRGRRLKVWRANVLAVPVGGDPLEPGMLRGDLVGTGSGVLQLIEVQPEGKARVSAAAWLNGARPEPDEHLGRAAR